MHTGKELEHGTLAVAALRIVLAIALAGSLYVQAVMGPLLWADLDDAPARIRTSLVGILILAVATMQVVAVSVWRLLTMVRRGTLFSHAALRSVDLVIGAFFAASLLAFALAVTLAPGEAVAPGIVLLVCGASLTLAGVALTVLVLRMLLARAVAVEPDARRLPAKPNEAT